MAKLELNERKQRLLMALVERHIRHGQPVGSKTLATGSGLAVSPATIRNLMAELEDMGLLASPHTSAGRVPTERGYRLYVDTLLASSTMERPDNARLRDELRQMLAPDQSPEALVSQASRSLAELTRMAGLVAVPRRDVTTLRQVEFLPLSGQRVLVVLVVNRSEVQNRIIQTSRDYNEVELRQAANYINKTYAGCDLDNICEGLLSTMDADRAQMDVLMQATMDIAGKALRQDRKDSDYVVSGESNLLEGGQMDSIEKVRDLFDAFNRKRDILHLLERSMKADGVQIFIGRESGYQPFEEYSLVSAPYKVDNGPVGVLAVVGPTRMDYEKVIPTVDITARILSAALTQL
ncbi:heat-inducible transcriptional repressor HrcA [Alloalcanivorax venustensis]|jgi:heat-inducible transcriptional repressor|uniref:Heat-inducible transcription repressor HrcA n=1 Tax=Alloalcanivorax venustensis ISO4 TaxID=1177184 RepID=A0ABS0AC63_9GAMM|nr:heat-inducible transcriptional repressor HrcA [Alloalcanivorax venustensis]MBF5051704.1 heat-inducible transcription repressor hrcA [Alloalcanivorax venustensis ISO4]MEC8879650.1 heat-inducible transcriptional repressor HrcA [Pseudomonadota bacterium]MEE3009575.1 heat-inducible transcriptional repressor HrcA [Pseudomonadota bacterium]MTI51201.1 heat-inducible transcription repressor HrcA [Alcanivorax sp.]|tara:strand:- start:63449 stop:64498 length:1050 start_codon:yes stop_codon:yes gene_type:complete